MHKGKYIVLDIETDGLIYKATLIHCATIYNSTTDSYIKFVNDGRSIFSHVPKISSLYEALQKYIEDDYLIVGHNIAAFDYFILRKFKDKYIKNGTEFVIPISQLRDTMLISQLLYPERPYSLEYFGKVFGEPKLAHEDWSKFSEDMMNRNIQDVKINKILWERLRERLQKDACWTDALSLETEVSIIQSKQEYTGIRFNIVEAQKLYKHLSQRETYLTQEILRDIPKTVISSGSVYKPFLVSGAVSTVALNWFNQDPNIRLVAPPSVWKGRPLVGTSSIIKLAGPFTKIEFRDINLDSHIEVKELLYSLGWVPTQWNYKKDSRGRILYDEHGEPIITSPKLTEDSYLSLPEGLGKTVADLLIVKHRKRWLRAKNGGGAFSEFRIPDKKHIVVSSAIPEGSMRIPARAITLGTPTARYRHCGVVCNLPKAKKKIPYGIQIRSLFVATPGWRLIGIDLKSIEARVMAHFTKKFDKGALEKIIMSSDIHEYNAKLLKTNRDTAKTFLYALSYGAKERKLASILGISQAKAKKIIEDFWIANFGLKALIESLETEFTRNKSSYITGIDGRKVFVRRKGTALNTKIQGTAAIIFKYWMFLMSLIIEALYKDTARQLLAYHDELLFEIDESIGEESIEDFIKLALDAIRSTGIFYDIQVPLEGEAKQGYNYAEVH